MSLKSFECAIARSQIGRYLAGDAVSDEAMSQLEAHISGCPDCQRLIDSKKEELLGPLAGAPTAEEALATSTDVAVIERELRAAAARTGRVVVESTEAPVAAEMHEHRTPVMAASGAGASVTASAPGFSTNGFPQGVPSAAPGGPSGPTGSATPANSSSAATSGASVSGIGAKFGRFSLPKLVREVPDPEPAFLTAGTASGMAAMDASATPAAPAMPAKTKRPLTKAAVYGGALLLVLGGMATMGDPIALLGGKAAAVTPVSAKTERAQAAPKTKKPQVAQATGVRRSAIGVPITDAADPDTEIQATPIAPKAKTRVAKAVPAAKAPAAKTLDETAEDAGLEYDPTLDAPAAVALAAKPKVAKPVATKTVLAKSISVKPTPAKPVKAKPIAVKSVPATRVATKPLAAKAVSPKAGVKLAPKAGRPTTKTVARPVLAKTRVATKIARPAVASQGGPQATVVPLIPKIAPSAKPVKVARKRRPAARRPKIVRKRVAPKSQNVIRVYDETGKPIN